MNLEMDIQLIKLITIVTHYSYTIAVHIEVVGHRVNGRIFGGDVDGSVRWRLE